MSHPLEAYLAENKSGAMTDEQARDSIEGLVNDPELLREVCSMFADVINVTERCFALGKVYDVGEERYGCVTVLSEDVAGVIGEDFLPKTHEELNYMLLCAYLEYRQFCREVDAVYDTWDDYLHFIMEKNFPSLFKNGVRARLIYNMPVEKAAMPTVAFILYQKYDELYG